VSEAFKGGVRNLKRNPFCPVGHLPLEYKVERGKELIRKDKLIPQQFQK